VVFAYSNKFASNLETKENRKVSYMNEIIGFVLLGLGIVIVLICLVAFLRVVFSQQKVKGATEVLEQINALIKNWVSLLAIVPDGFKHIFALLPFGLVFVLLGLYILIRKPI